MLDPKEILAFQEKVRNDPLWFVNTVLNRPTWAKEEEIIKAVRSYPEIAVRSCNGSGKTYTAGGIVHWWLTAFQDSVVLTTAPTFRQVKELLWREIRSAVVKGLYPPTAVLDTAINLGEKWFAIGLSSDKPDQFQGFHSKHLLAIVDEASGVEEPIMQAIDGLNPTCILMLGNPMKNTGRFAESFKRPSVHKIMISAFDTPNLKEGHLVIPGLISQRDVDRIREKYGEDSDVYRIRVLGEFPKVDPDTLFSVDEIAQAIAREVAVLPHWEKKMGVDPARFGDDRTAIVVRQMEKVVFKQVFSGLDTMQVVGNVIRIAREERVSSSNIAVDSIGLGAGVVDRLKEQGWAVNGISVADAATDNEHYANLRAELYAGKLKEWIKTASLPDDDFYELSNIKYKFTSAGKMQLERKEDIKKRGLPSPDIADALALTFANPNRIFYGGPSPITAIPDGGSLLPIYGGAS